MSISPGLLAAYLSTDFEVHTTKATIVLKIEKANPEFDQDLTNNKVESAVIITAWNPWSQLRSQKDNDDHQSQMEDQLEKAGFLLIPAAGADPSGEWQSEQSCCVLGMTEEEGIQWGQRYQQNAVVYHERGKKTKLVTV